MPKTEEDRKAREAINDLIVGRLSQKKRGQPGRRRKGERGENFSLRLA
jgi:hypothetical protein